ncbi:hypothetical protein R1sor_017966 [Riccia sorocarpa]|uniref:Hydroxyproline O-arabinosyltransferase-like domain-containing protein n=1 Tax=Riccia sorocarpa TaxID=122646 RepID=A0ABD3IBM8_9MARC
MAGTLPPLRLVLAILRIGYLFFSVASGYKLSELDDQLQDMPKAPWRMHTLFSVECRDYFDWQTVGLIHSLRKSGQPGPVTRLLSCTERDLVTYKGHDLAPTLNVPSMSKNPVNGDWYPAINKPAGVVHWLNHSEEAKHVDWVVILDADMIMRRPITPWEVGAEKGKPVSASYGYLVGCDNELATIHTAHPEFCDKVGGFIVMHIDDLRAMAPLWLSKTQEVRADKDHWATKYTGDIYSSGWISEMYGYSFGAAEVGLRHKINDDLMIYPGYIPLPGQEPSVLHYGLRFNVSSWYFDKAEHLNNRIVYECNKLFLPPPYPEQVEIIAKNEEVRHALLLSIECINTLNEGLVLNHAKRGCPKPSKTEYLEFLLSGSDPSSRQRPKVVEQTGSEDATRQKWIGSGEAVGKSSVGNELKLPHPRIHTLFSTECNDYFDWQTLGLYHSFQLSGQPGFITRLLSCTDEKLATYKNMDLAPTHVVPSYSVHPLTGDRYPAINKPVGVLHWLNHVKMDVEYVVILDADMILRGPITPWEFGASRGKPVSVPYDYLIGCDNELARLHTRYPEHCQKVGGIIIMHIEDLRLFAPLWLSKTEEVRADKTHWATKITGDVYGKGWISEMYGYVFGAAELKLQHIIRNDIMLYPGYIPLPGVEVRVLHYGLNFTVGNWSWDKHSWRNGDMTSECWRQFPSPPNPSTLKWSSVLEERRDRLSIECLKTLNEALYLYHKRKGCQLKSQSDAMEDGGQFKHAMVKNSQEETVDGGNFKGSADFELVVNHDDIFESLEEERAETDRSSQTRRKRLATGLTSRTSSATNSRYWMVALWISACILFWALVMLGVSTVYSRSRSQVNNKVRQYKVKPRRFDSEFRKEKLEVRLPELHP